MREFRFTPGLGLVVGCANESETLSNAEAEAHNAALDACRAQQLAPKTPGK